MALGGTEQFAQHLAQRHLAQRPGKVGLAHRARGRLQLVDAHRCRHPACLHVQLGDAPVVLVEDGHEVLGQVVLVLRRELADDAEIQHHEARILAPGRMVVDPDVAGVRVGVEEVVAEHLGVEHPHALFGQLAAVDPGRIQRGDVVGGNAGDPLHGQRALGAVAPHHLRHVQVRRVCPQPAHDAGVGAFALEVQFGGQGGLDLVHHQLRADPVGIGMGAVDQRGQRAQQGDVGGDLLLDARAQHLDHHLAPVAQARAMHLGDRGRSQRRGVEAGEGLGHRPAQRLLDDLPGRIAIEGCDLVLQQGQFFGDVRRHQVAPGGQDLPELDEDRAQLLQGQAQARTARQRGHLRRRTRHERLAQAQPALRRGVIEQIVQAVMQDHPADAPGPQRRLHARLPKAVPVIAWPLMTRPRPGPGATPVRRCVRRRRAGHRPGHGRPSVQRARPRRRFPR